MKKFPEQSLPSQAPVRLYSALGKSLKASRQSATPLRTMAETMAAQAKAAECSPCERAWLALLRRI